MRLNIKNWTVHREKIEKLPDSEISVILILYYFHPWGKKKPNWSVISHRKEISMQGAR